MKTFKDPTINFDLELPTYTEITKIISKMKSSASPCPLDQVSVIAFKKWPILRSHLTKIIQLAQKSRKLGNLAQQCSLIKKGDPDEPENFCPITLQPVLSKVFTSIIRNRLYQFLEKMSIQNQIFKRISGKKSEVVLSSSKHLRISSTMLY